MEETTNTEIKDSNDQIDEKPIEKMTSTELRDVAKKIPGVTGTVAMKKEELLSIIKKHRGIEDSALTKKPRKKIRKSRLTVKELKQKALKLRKEKKEAQSGKGRKKINFLRRRINRIKKQTRKVARA